MKRSCCNDDTQNCTDNRLSLNLFFRYRALTRALCSKNSTTNGALHLFRGLDRFAAGQRRGRRSTWHSFSSAFFFFLNCHPRPPHPHPPSPQKNMHLFLQTLSYMFNELFSQGYRPIALNLATSIACAAYSLFRSHKGFLADTPWSTYSLLVAAPPPRGPNSQ